MPRQNLNKLTGELFQAFRDLSGEFQRSDIVTVMPTDVPQRGRLLSEFARAGAQVCIAGGKKDARAFVNIPQFGLETDSTFYSGAFSEEVARLIVNALPEEILRGKNIALFVYSSASQLWEKHIHERGLGTNIVASNEQNTNHFFEEKGNLVTILQKAGLKNYAIPTERIHGLEAPEDLRQIYHRIKNDMGKVVIQDCGKVNAGGKGTVFVNGEGEFLAETVGTHTERKVTRFIEGVNANLSLFAGNTKPNDQGRGVTRLNLPEDIDPCDPSSLDTIQKAALERGLYSGNTFSVTGRATLKVVGDPILTNNAANGVGNNIGHIYDRDIREQEQEIGSKLGKLMAQCGKVGLAGADLIIDINGKIWINEINDRQQGPTDQMSCDAEREGLPGLSRIALFANYADFTKDENLGLLKKIWSAADRISQKYMNSKGSFYLKIHATHGAEFNGRVKAIRDVNSGYYEVRRNNKEWTWKFLGDKTSSTQSVDIKSGVIILHLEGGSLKKGEKPVSGAQLFRVTGVADKRNAPFTVTHGLSRLSANWRPIIKELYKHCFGPHYMEKNPLIARDIRKAQGCLHL